jgi:hypothetical protein
MAYAALMGAALYLAWALPLRIAFDVAIPLAPIAAGVVALQLVQATAYWATRSRLVQWLGTMAAFWAYLVLALRRAGFTIRGDAFAPDQWPILFDYSFVDYALIVVIALVCFAVTVAGVARQRRGDAQSDAPRMAGTSSAWNWFAGLFRFRCPTSSATRAQLWFELRSSGLTILGVGCLVAIVMPLIFAAGARAEFFRSTALGIPLMSTMGLLVLGGNAFGIRRKQGVTYASLFDSTQASRTGSMATLKVVTRSVTVLAALGIMAVSVVLSSSLTRYWPTAAPDVANYHKLQDDIATGISTLRAWDLAALAVIVAAAITVLVTARAVIEALFVRYRARVVVVVAALLLFVLALGLSGMLHEGESPRRLLNAALGATLWIIAATVALTTVYLFWRAIAEGLFTPLQAGIAVLVSAVFLAAWLTFLRAVGVSLGDLSMGSAVATVWPVTLPLLASVVAPWSLSRVRHG